MAVSLWDSASDLGRRLEAARQAANLSQRELALILRCSERSVQDYEAGKAFPRPALRRRIAAFLTDSSEQVA